MNEKIVAILGDSRAFDTYYLNPYYEAGYGYDKTFPHVLCKSMAASDVDVVHIPDHFRGGNVENNIIRLSLTNPCVVVLLNGIWETLVNKKMFLDYAAERIKAFETRGGEILTLTYSSRVLADLFKAGELSHSPRRYVERERRLISYFRRRGRQVVVMNLPVPDENHLNRVHYAGNYRCIREWGECLEALNAGLGPVAEEYGAVLADTNQWMREHGGPAQSLIDQWHFSVSFHQAVAGRLQDIIAGSIDEHRLPDEHVSHEYMVPGKTLGEPVLVCGTGSFASEWIRSHPTIRVEAVIDEGPGREHFQSIPVIMKEDVKDANARILVPAVEQEARGSLETGLLRTLPRDKIIVYPEETEGVFNPLTGDPEG